AARLAGAEGERDRRPAGLERHAAGAGLALVAPVSDGAVARGGVAGAEAGELGARRRLFRAPALLEGLVGAGQRPRVPAPGVRRDDVGRRGQRALHAVDVVEDRLETLEGCGEARGARGGLDGLATTQAVRADARGDETAGERDDGGGADDEAARRQRHPRALG